MQQQQENVFFVLNPYNPLQQLNENNINEKKIIEENNQILSNCEKIAYYVFDLKTISEIQLIPGFHKIAKNFFIPLKACHLDDSNSFITFQESLDQDASDQFIFEKLKNESKNFETKTLEIKKSMLINYKDTEKVNVSKDFIHLFQDNWIKPKTISAHWDDSFHTDDIFYDFSSLEIDRFICNRNELLNNLMSEIIQTKREISCFPNEYSSSEIFYCLIIDIRIPIKISNNVENILWNFEHSSLNISAKEKEILMKWDEKELEKIGKYFARFGFVLVSFVINTLPEIIQQQASILSKYLIRQTWNCIDENKSFFTLYY